MTTVHTAITGSVTKINGNGFRLDSREGWLNISRYGKADEAPMPSVGQHVTVALDKAGYVRKIEPVTPAANAEPQAPTPTAGMLPDKDRLMLRMSALRGACEVFAGSGQSPEVILRLAEDLEAWALS